MYNLQNFKKIIPHEKKLIEPNGVIAFNIPAYGTIENLILEFWNGNQIAKREDALKAIGQVELNVENDKHLDVDLRDIDNLRLSMGVKVQSASDAGIFELLVAKYAFDDIPNQQYFSIGTAIIPAGGTTAVSVGIDLQLHANETITGVTHVKLYTVRRTVTKIYDKNPILKFIAHPQNLEGAGEHNIQTLPKKQTDAYLGFIIDAPDAEIAESKIDVNNKEFIKYTRIETNKYFQNLREFQQLDGQFLHMFGDGSAIAGIPMAGVTDLSLVTNFISGPTSKNYRILSLAIGNYPDSMLKLITNSATPTQEI